MNRHTACRSGEREPGFTVIELLVALAIVLVIAAVLAHVVQPARVVFERVPADLELQQRGRTAIAVMAQALRSAGRNVAATTALSALSEMLPVVSLTGPDASGETFTTLTVIAPAVDAAQGVLAVDQAGNGGAIALATMPCPNVREVCGFSAGMTAVIADGSGHYDVFVVAAAVAGASTLNADRAFSQPYPAGSAVIEIDHHTFSLAAQSDGSFSLVRETAAGAVQPVVDFATALAFRASDRRVDVAVTLQAATGSLRRLLDERAFRTTVTLRNVQ